MEEVVGGIRRTLAESGGGAGGKGPGGGMGTGTEARVPGTRSAGRPEAEPFTPPGTLRTAAVEGIEAVPPGNAAGAPAPRLVVAGLAGVCHG